MTRGTTPKIAYLATISATRASIGMAGYGMPEKSIQPISAVRSTPVTSSTSLALSAPGLTSWRVITPSISTVGEPLIVATIWVRRIGGSVAPATRKIVCSGECLLRLNDRRNPPGVPRSADSVTSTLIRSSMASRGSGTGTTGPTMIDSVRRLAITRPPGCLRAA